MVITFSAEAKFTLTKDEISTLMECRHRHPDRHVRWATAPTGFVAQAHQKVMNSHSENVEVSLSTNELEILLSLLRNGKNAEPAISALKRKILYILQQLQDQENEVSGKASISPFTEAPAM